MPLPVAAGRDHPTDVGCVVPTSDDDHQAALRLLAVVRQKLQAPDARFELGGEDPSDSHVVWCRLPGRPHWRVVVDLGPKRQATDDDRERLALLLQVFSQSTLPQPLNFQRARFADRQAAAKASRAASITADPARQALDRALEELRQHTGAELACIIDRDTPVFLGMAWQQTNDSSPPPPSLETLLNTSAISGTAPALHRCGAALRQLRNRLRDEPLLHRLACLEASCNYLARGLRDLGGSYTVLLCFPETFSELATDSALRQRQNGIARLVRSLRPLDPDPDPGRVLSLKRPST